MELTLLIQDIFLYHIPLRILFNFPISKKFPFLKTAGY